MNFPDHLINCRVTLKAPSNTPANGVPVITNPSNTYTDVPARIMPESSSLSMDFQGPTGIRYSGALLPTRNGAGASLMVGRDWQVVVSAVYGLDGASMLTVGQAFRVEGPGVNMGGQDVIQSVRLAEVLAS